MTNIQNYAKKIIFILERDYSKQIEFSGIIRQLHNLMMKIVSQNINIEIDYSSLVRQFVDETIDYDSPIIIYLEKMAQETKSERKN